MTTVHRTASVPNTVIGNNDALIANVASLYLQNGARVADVTYGRGGFWHQIDLSLVTLLASDRQRPAGRTEAQDSEEDEPAQASLFPTARWCPPPTLAFLLADFRALPYPDASLDVLVLDPPYLHAAGEHLTSRRKRSYGLTETLSHQAILRTVYCRGIQEAYRVLRPGGQLWVKGKDEIENNRQCLSDMELIHAAARCGFPRVQDRFHLVNPANMTKHEQRQHHARKMQSFLLILRRDRGHLLAPRGRPRKGSVCTTIKGNRGVQYLTARLLRDHPDVLARYMAGELTTVHAAARAAGLVQPRRPGCGDERAS